MWQPYLRVIREKCSQAIHILDRFHIVAKMNKALDEVRAGEARKMVRQGYEPLLKKTRRCLLKRKDNLSTPQRFRLRRCTSIFQSKNEPEIGPGGKGSSAGRESPF